MYDTKTIKDIFYSNSHTFRWDKQLIVNIIFLLENNFLSFTKLKITTKDNYNKYVDKLNLGEIPQFDIQGGSIGHMALILTSKDYLIENKKETIEFEQNFEGYIPDVITGDKEIIIECGNTEPDKIFNYFKNKNLKKLIILPYPNDESEDIFIYTFIPGKDLKNFLFFKEEEERKKMKEKLKFSS